MRRWLSILLLCSPVSAWASASPDVLAQVQAILNKLGQSKCEFQRNGTWYGPEQASAHLLKKFEYLNKRNLANTVPLFIERAGTQSSMSGKAYSVRCPGQAEVSSAAWLNQAWAAVQAGNEPK